MVFAARAVELLIVLCLRTLLQQQRVAGEQARQGESKVNWFVSEMSLKFVWNWISQIAQDIRTLHDTLCRFKSILVDPAEFACLKAIVLFRSEAKGLKDATQIENLQDQAQVIDAAERER